MTWVGAVWALGGALVAGFALRAALAANVPRWVLLAALLAPVVWILGDEGWRIHSHHGLLHTSIVYTIFDRGAPPENPLLAGHPLGYPFGHHFLIARAMRVVDVAPPWLFAATNLACLALVAILLARTARLFSPNPGYRVLVVFLALFGSNPFSLGAPIRVLHLLGLSTETRLAPLLKFMTLNSSPLGIVFLAAAMYGTVQLFQRDDGRPGALAWVLLGYVGAGLLYPVAWWSVGGCILAAAFVLATADGGGAQRRKAVGLVAVFVLGAIPLVPWFLFLDAGKAEPSYPNLFHSLAHVGRNGVVVALAAALPLALLVGPRVPSVVPRLAARWLALASAGLALAFVAAHLAIHSEYWILMSAQLPLAFLLAEPLRRLCQEHRWIGSAVLVALIAPTTWFLADKGASPWTPTDPASTLERRLVHDDPAERALHDWILAGTPPEAVLIDTHLSLPAFARRPLFVGLDVPRAGDVDTNGVGLSADRWLRLVHGRDPAVLEARARAASDLVGAAPAGTVRAALEVVRREVGGRDVYAVARTPDVAKRLEAAGLERAYTDGEVSVFRLAARRR